MNELSLSLPLYNRLSGNVGNRNTLLVHLHNGAFHLLSCNTMHYFEGTKDSTVEHSCLFFIPKHWGLCNHEAMIDFVFGIEVFGFFVFTFLLLFFRTSLLPLPQFRVPYPGRNTLYILLRTVSWKNNVLIAPIVSSLGAVCPDLTFTTWRLGRALSDWLKVWLPRVLYLFLSVCHPLCLSWPWSKWPWLSMGQTNKPLTAII